MSVASTFPRAMDLSNFDTVHGPLFYSDVEEKMLGVITVGGRLSFFHVSREPVVGDAAILKDAAMKHLEAAVKERI